jgi:hypothetical protein
VNVYEEISPVAGHKRLVGNRMPERASQEWSLVPGSPVPQFPISESPHRLPCGSVASPVARGGRRKRLARRRVAAAGANRLARMVAVRTNVEARRRSLQATSHRIRARVPRSLGTSCRRFSRINRPARCTSTAASRRSGRLVLLGTGNEDAVMSYVQRTRWGEMRAVAKVTRRSAFLCARRRASAR